MWKIKLPKILGNLWEKLRKLYLIGTVGHVEMFSCPHTIEKSRHYLRSRIDILQKTVVGCPWHFLFILLLHEVFLPDHAPSFWHERTRDPDSRWPLLQEKVAWEPNSDPHDWDTIEPFVGEWRVGQDFPMRNEDLTVNNNMIQLIPAVVFIALCQSEFRRSGRGDFLNHPNKRGFHCGRWQPLEQKTIRKRMNWI